MCGKSAADDPLTLRVSNRIATRNPAKAEVEGGEVAPAREHWLPDAINRPSRSTAELHGLLQRRRPALGGAAQLLQALPVAADRVATRRRERDAGIWDLALERLRDCHEAAVFE